MVNFPSKKAGCLRTRITGVPSARGGNIGRVAEVSGQEPHNRDVAEQSVEHPGPWIFFLNFKVGEVVAGFKHIISSAPNRTHALPTDGAEVVAFMVGKKVAGRPVNHLVRLDACDLPGFVRVRKHLDVFLKFEQLLFDVTDGVVLVVADNDLGGDGNDFEA